MASATEEEASKLRVFFIPFFASGHMIPMTDLARLFAGRPGVEPTIVVTPANAALIRPTLDRSAADGRPVRLLLYPFPSVGLPPGVENLSTATASEAWRVYKAVDLAQEAHDQLLRHHHPDAIVADVPLWWTTPIAADLGIPRVTFHAVGVFPQLAMNNLTKIRSKIREVENGSEQIAVPDFPGPPITIPMSELPEFLRSPDHLTEAWDRLKEAQLESYGVVVNTFHELEPEYCDLFRKVDCKRAWFVGPVALSYGEGAKERGGGGTAAEGGNRCLKWLDTKEEGSVAFVCFGSWCHFTAEQLREVAAGLEASGKAFLWAVRGTTEEAAKTEEWMPEGWEERVGERGLVVRGWAPQVAILEHKAVGAFLTHCGWNSVLEAAVAGVPMLTWPLAFEQFINERLVVEVMGAGKRVWDGFRSTLAEERVVVPGEAIGRTVSGFMEPGGEGARAKRRAREYAAMARAAVAEGGSAHRDLGGLVDELVAMKNDRKMTGHERETR
ncbi:scopoletin glucosyltransferase-like [Phoenix dactylifera]|uniref:Glycosyltransferase n=1 Tax=Phoenix dactylifera TaxID=42345 RepID=A0A8B7D2F3_PHODC|nr:scopoletin glucosyltransferase-like [Phoenix dactylifera]